MPRKRPDPTDGEAVTPDSSAAPKAEPAEPPAETPPEPAAEAPEPAEPDAPPEPPLEAGPAESSAEPGPKPAPEVAPLMEPAAAEAHEEAPDEHHEEEPGPSFAARALTVLLLLIAGAALGIWGAPRLAPLLPSGLAPVAAWLTPGQREAEARVAALETRLDQGLGEMQSRIASLTAGDDVDARVATAVGAAEDRLRAAIADLQQRVDQSDGADLRQRLARAEAAVEGQAAELATIKDQLSGSVAAGGQLSQEAAAKIDVYRAELDGLRAEMGPLQDRVGALAARIDQVAAEADRQITTAQSKVDEIQAAADTRAGAAETGADLALIRAALASGQPFEQPLARLAERSVPVPAGLTAAAASGVPTLATLRDQFPDAAHAAIRASILAGAGSGILARSRAFLEAQMASRSLTPQPGMGPDAVLSRMEDRLRRDDLDGALAEAEHLPSEAAAAMTGWLAAARLRAAAVDGLAELDAILSATN